jgi:hypothetical protein
MQKGNWNSALNRRDWRMTIGGLLITARAAAQSKLLPLNSSGLDHLSITVPDAAAAATFYGKIFDPQVFHERTGVQRYYVRLGSAYLAFGPQANATPFLTLLRQSCGLRSGGRDSKAHEAGIARGTRL